MLEVALRHSSQIQQLKDVFKYVQYLIYYLDNPLTEHALHLVHKELIQTLTLNNVSFNAHQN